MILVEPGCTVREQDDMLRHIEWAGRTCYQSDTGAVTDESAKKFVDMLVARGHMSVLEHGTAYLDLPWEYHPDRTWCRHVLHGGHTCVTTNYRDILENMGRHVLGYLCEPGEMHERRVSVRFITSRGIAQELTRHRAFSFSMESQRYCNYGAGRFGSQVTFVKPYWCGMKPGGYDSMLDVARQTDDERDTRFMKACLDSSHAYFSLLGLGCKPQEAREVLCNACKTELVMTGFLSDWKGFFDLRYHAKAGNPHPDARKLAGMARDKLMEAGYDGL